MEEFMVFFIDFICITLVFLLGMNVATDYVMKQAYEHGVAFECKGKAGYYFTCDGDDKK